MRSCREGPIERENDDDDDDDALAALLAKAFFCLLINTSLRTTRVITRAARFSYAVIIRWFSATFRTRKLIFAM